MPTMTRATRSPTPLPLLVAVAALVVMLAAPGMSLHCWVCRSDNESRCADPFDNATLSATNCSHVPLRDGEARFCSKMRAEVNGKTVYYRSCSDKEGLCPNVEHAGLCSTCKKDYCNGAERPGGGRLAPLATAAAAALAALAAAGAGRP